MKRWDTQLTSLAQVRGLIEAGKRRIGLTAPTGGGKSLCIHDMCKWGWSTIIYCNRTMLAEQFFADLEKQGLDFGIQIGGYADEAHKDVQVASIQTVHKRWKDGKQNLFPAKLIIVDEIHLEKGERMQELLNTHLELGAVAYVVVTATPLGIAHLCDDLVIAGATSDLRRCGALLPAKTYAPDEPALKAFTKERGDIIKLRKEAKRTILPVMFGRVVEHWRRLNPEGKPTVLFAEDVAASQWFAESLHREGIPAAHIDASRIWMNGVTMAANRANRKSLSEASESGEIKIACNRFVLREAVNWPWLYHAILTAKIGSLAMYVQMGGRILRAHPSMDHVIIQDHGGNYWRHDSINCDREWSLEKTERQMIQERAEAYRTKALAEPRTCPRCTKVYKWGVSCPECGYTSKQRSRMVIQTSGRLEEVRGDIYHARKKAVRPELHQSWIKCVFSCRNANRTMNQARAKFQRENNGLSPGDNFPFMPRNESDWYLPVAKLFPRKEKVNADQR